MICRGVYLVMQKPRVCMKHTGEVVEVWNLASFSVLLYKCIDDTIFAGRYVWGKSDLIENLAFQRNICVRRPEQVVNEIWDYA